MLQIFAFIIGLAIGSFVNVLADGLAHGQSLTKALRFGRSYCDHCHKPLGWYELVPILSFVLLKGRCLGCRRPIPWRYPLVELAVGLVALATIVYYRDPLPAILGFGLMLTLVVLALVDAQTKTVPEAGLQLALYLSIAWMIVQFYGGQPIEANFLGLVFAAAATSPLVFIAHGTLMGEADLLVAMIIGLWLGFPAVLMVVMLSFILGGLVGLALIITKKAKRSDKIGFIPFLVTAALIVFFFGEQIINRYFLL